MRTNGKSPKKNDLISVNRNVKRITKISKERSIAKLIADEDKLIMDLEEKFLV